MTIKIVRVFSNITTKLIDKQFLNLKEEKKISARAEREIKKEFLTLSQEVGNLIQSEVNELEMTRHEAADYLQFRAGISRHNAYLRILELHKTPYNITVKTLVAVLNVFGYRLVIEKKPGSK